MAITRITAQWNGFRGAPGYSNFFFDDALAGAPAVEAAAVAVATFFEDISSRIPTGTSITIQPTADVLDEASGQITSVIDFSAPPSISGGNSGGYSAATGAVVNWNTSDYVNGRRVRGRTFIVPLGSSVFDGAGDLTSVSLSQIRTAAETLIGTTLDAPMCVWHRPVNGSGGSAHVISSATVPDLGAVLRSRRD